MTLRQLEGFVAVAREGSFTFAAHKTHIAQPTLSEQVGELEQELGTKLFARQGRKILLTEAGRVLAEHAAGVLASVARARQTIAELSGLTRGSLAIGASTTPGIYVLPRVLGDFQSRYPGITVSLRTANSKAIQEGIRRGDFDLGVVGGHVLDPTEPCLDAGFIDELVLIAPPKHPAARHGRISPGRLAQFVFLTRERGSATRQVAERGLARAGIRVRTGLELDHTEAIKRAVIAGLGVAFVSKFAVQDEVASKRLVVVRVPGLRLRRHFHVIHDERRTLSASGRAFLAILDEHAVTARVRGRRTRRRG